MFESSTRAHQLDLQLQCPVERVKRRRRSRSRSGTREIYTGGFPPSPPAEEGLLDEKFSTPSMDQSVTSSFSPSISPPRSCFRFSPGRRAVRRCEKHVWRRGYDEELMMLMDAVLYGRELSFPFSSEIGGTLSPLAGGDTCKDEDNNNGKGTLSDEEVKPELLPSPLSTGWPLKDDKRDAVDNR